MSPDPPRELRPEDVTFDELNKNSEGNWRLQGPNSGGGTDLYRYKGQLFVVGYGDYSTLPGGAEQVIGVREDNTPGFAPRMPDGHAAGCAHEAYWNWDWWMHALCLLRVHQEGVELHEAGKKTWDCSLRAFLAPDSPQHADVLRLMGPNVADEAVRCAERRLPR